MPGRRCAVAVCKNSRVKTKLVNPDIKYHEFPFGNDLVLQEWIRSCRRADEWNPATSQICSVHFTSGDYERDLEHELLGLPVRRHLKKSAVPTLLLGHKGESTDKALKMKERKSGISQRRPGPRSRTQTDFPINENSIGTENWEQKYNELKEAFENIKKEKSIMSKQVKQLNLQLKFYKCKYQTLLKRKR